MLQIGKPTPLLKTCLELAVVGIYEFEVGFYNYLKFLAIFFLKTCTVPRLSFSHWGSQTSGGFFFSNFLELRLPYSGSSGKYTKDVNHFFYLLCHGTLLAIQNISSKSNQGIWSY